MDLAIRPSRDCRTDPLGITQGKFVRQAAHIPPALGYYLAHLMHLRYSAFCCNSPAPLVVNAAVVDSCVEYCSIQLVFNHS